jgi:hypothetical protein
MRQVYDGDPDGEGVIWPRLAEISLLGAIGCGGWLMRSILEELEAPESKYNYAVLQATENSVPFYESLGFIRVGALARYDDQGPPCARESNEAELAETQQKQASARSMLELWDIVTENRFIEHRRMMLGF